MDDEDKLCPFCGSLSRSRRLWHILTSEFFGEPLAILDFSPLRSLYRALKRKADVNYTSTDISGDFLSDYQFDITDIACENDRYDLIICYHILEHVENDERAMSELYRVLRKGGSCLIQTPFKDGNTYEDPSIITETERLKHFGQKDHVRVYSPDSLKQRLVSCGFQVVVKQYKEVEENEFGFKTDEQVIFCTK